MNTASELSARIENFVAATIFFIVFGVYLTTMCHTVSFTDSGELATVATTLGIAHPTGYPLWTLIGRLFVMLPFGGQEIIHLNVLASLLTALAVGFYFKLLLIIFRSHRVFGVRKDATGVVNRWMAVFAAFVTALSVGFSSTIWAQSVEIEVYALHALLVTIIVILFVSGIEAQLTEHQIVSPHLILFSYVLGLSFSNHMTTILLAPGFLYLFFVTLGSNKRSWQIIVLLVPFFLLGLSTYIYTPIRAATGTLMDWGNPVTLQRFWWHVTGKQYQTWMFAGTDVIRKQLLYFFTNFPTEFEWPLIVLLLFGIIETFKRSKKLFLFLMILFLACLAYTVNYDIHEIDPYFMLAYLACGCFLGIGVASVVGWGATQKPRYALLVTLVILMSLPVLQVSGNRRDVDQSTNDQAADFVRNVLSQLEPNAVVFSSLWDYFVSPSYYCQLVRKERPDVVIVDEQLLQNRTWYFIQLERDHPGFLHSSEAQVNAFLVELNKFEEGEPFDFFTIKNRWDDLLEALVSKLLKVRPVYVDARIVSAFPKNFEAVPQGLMIRLANAGEKAEWRPIQAVFKRGTFSNYVTSDLRLYYATMYTYHAYWLLGKRRLSEADESLREALRVDSTYAPAIAIKARMSLRGG